MILPCHVIFADPADLKLQFHREVKIEEIQLMEEWSLEEGMMQMGLDRYISEWNGKNSILAPLLVEKTIQFWWD